LKTTRLACARLVSFLRPLPYSETVLFRDTKKTLQWSPIAFSCQYSINTYQTKNRLSGGQQTKECPLGPPFELVVCYIHTDKESII